MGAGIPMGGDIVGSRKPKIHTIYVYKYFQLVALSHPDIVLPRQIRGELNRLCVSNRQARHRRSI